MKQIVAIATAVFCFSCSPAAPAPQQYDQTQKSVTPKGTIYVRVLDTATLNPLSGASVTVLGADVAALTTDMKGIAKLENAVVASSYNFIVEKEGYLRARTGNVALSATTGNSPLEGPIATTSIELYPNTGKIEGIVFLPNGRPAEGANVFIDQRNFGESVVTAVTDATGAFALPGLAVRPAGASHTVIAQWFDENGDGTADYAAATSNITVYPNQASRLFLTYNANTVGQRIVATNIADGEVAGGEDLSFTFALPVVTTNLNGNGRSAFVLTNLSRNNAVVPVDATFSSATQVAIKPATGNLFDGDRYSLAFSLRNLNAANQGTDSNFSPTLVFQVRPATVTGFSTQVSGLTVSNPNPVSPFGPQAFNFNDNTFAIVFNQVTGAMGYEVFVRDTTLNQNYVLVGTIANPTSSRVAFSVNLAGFPQFDQLPGGAVEPLVGSNQLTIAVVPFDAFGNRAPVSAAATVTVRDSIPATITAGPTLLTTSPADGINDTSAPQLIRLRMTYSEPMDVASMVTFTVAAATAPTSTWAWETVNATSGVLTITVPAGADATGSFVIRGGRDAAGNAVSQASDRVGVLGGRRELLTNGEFISGTMCSLGSWAPSSTVLPAPATQNNNGAISGATSACAAVLGPIPGTTPAGPGTARITQQVSLPTISMINAGNWTLSASVKARMVTAAANLTGTSSFTGRCRVNDITDMLLQAFAVGGTNASQNAYQSSTVDLTGSQGSDVRIVCDMQNTGTTGEGNAALYVDEVTVGLIKAGSL